MGPVDAHGRFSIFVMTRLSLCITSCLNGDSGLLLLLWLFSVKHSAQTKWRVLSKCKTRDEHPVKHLGITGVCFVFFGVVFFFRLSYSSSFSNFVFFFLYMPPPCLPPTPLHSYYFSTFASSYSFSFSSLTSSSSLHLPSPSPQSPSHSSPPPTPLYFLLHPLLLHSDTSTD